MQDKVSNRRSYIWILSQDTSLLCSDSGSERGCVELTLLFDAPVRNMTVHVLQARSLPHKTGSQVLQSQASWLINMKYLDNILLNTLYIGLQL